MSTLDSPPPGGIWPPPLGGDMDNDGYTTPCPDAAACPVPTISASHHVGPPGGYTKHPPTPTPSASTTVSSQPAILPKTSGPPGDAILAYVALGAGLVVLGLLLFVATRRRRRAT